MWCFMLMLTAIPSSGIGAFGGLVSMSKVASLMRKITKGFGFNSFDTILYQLPYPVMVAVVLLSSTWLINRVKLRFPIIA